MKSEGNPLMGIYYWHARFNEAGFKWRQKQNVVAEIPRIITKKEKLKAVLNVVRGYGRVCIYPAKYGFDG